MAEPGLASSTGRCCSSLSTLHRCPAPATDQDPCRSHTAMKCASSFPHFDSFPLKFLMLWWNLWLSKWLFLFSCRIFLLKCSHTTIFTLSSCVVTMWLNSRAHQDMGHVFKSLFESLLLMSVCLRARTCLFVGEAAETRCHDGPKPAVVMGWVWKECAAGCIVGKTVVFVLVWGVDGLWHGGITPGSLCGTHDGQERGCCSFTLHIKAMESPIVERSREFLECEFEMWSLLRCSVDTEGFLGLQKPPWSIWPPVYALASHVIRRRAHPNHVFFFFFVRMNTLATLWSSGLWWWGNALKGHEHK